jgi:hypothetical protein
MDTITVTLVRVDGSIDENASQDAFSAALSKHIASTEMETSKIASAISAVFDEFKGQSIPMPALCNFALTRLGSSPANYKVLNERTAQYVRENAQGDKDKATGTVAHPDSLFVINKGSGGGCARRADLAVKA